MYFLIECSCVLLLVNPHYLWNSHISHFDLLIQSQSISTVTLSVEPILKVVYASIWNKKHSSKSIDNIAWYGSFLAYNTDNLAPYCISNPIHSIHLFKYSYKFSIIFYYYLCPQVDRVFAYTLPRYTTSSRVTNWFCYQVIWIL